MIALQSKALQTRLIPVCRWKRCRSAATDRLGILCGRHDAYALAMPSDAELRRQGVTFAQWSAAWRAEHGRRRRRAA